MGWDKFNPENSKNPFDSFGLHHNETLDFVLTGFLKLPLRTDGPQVMFLHLSKMISDFLYLKSDKNDLSELEEILNACYVAMGRVLSNRDASILIHSKGSSAFVQYYSSLRRLLPNTDVDNVADTLEAIRDLEDTVESSSMSEDEQRIAYWASSTARYSLAYWINEFNIESSLWVSTAVRIGGWEDLPVKVSSGPPQWVTDDIEGAVIGAFFTGNPFTALGGGVATSAFNELRRYGSGSGWW